MLLNYAMEAIDFQSQTFREDLIEAIKPIKKMKYLDIKETLEIERIASVIKNHTNINVRFGLASYGPCVVTPDLDKNNPLIKAIHKPFFDNSSGLKFLANAGGLIRGSVNRASNKVRGIFAELEVRIIIPAEYFNNIEISAAMIAAVILHEVGHIFTYYEMMSGTVTTNYVLSGMTRALDETDTQDERETILLAVTKHLGLTELDIKELAKATNSKVSELVVVRAINRVPRSELGSGLYDANNWEQLADMYAARCGAGKDLVKVLDLLYRTGYKHISFRSSSEYWVMEGLKLYFLLGTIAINIVGRKPGLFNKIYCAMAERVWSAVFFFMIKADGAGDGTYDRPGIRFTRIRQEIVENLKNRDLPKSEVNKLTADIEIIDDYLAEVKDRLQVSTYLWTLFSNDLSKRLDQEKLQSELEALASNDLFVKSAKLAK